MKIKTIMAILASVALVAGCSRDGHDDHDHPHPHQQEKETKGGHGHDHPHPHPHQQEEKGGEKHDHPHPHKEGENAEHDHDHDKDHKHDHGDHDHGDHDHDHLPGVEVKASLSSQKLIGLKTVQVAKRRINSTVTLPGQFELAPNARTAAAAPVSGRVAIKVQPLQKVSAGSVLFTVTSPDLVSRAKEIAELEKRLAEYEATGAKNAALKSDIAVRKSARAALVGTAEEKDGVVTVKADRDGIVESVELAGGSFAESGGKVLTLVDPQSLRFVSKVTPTDLAKLRDGLPVTVQGRVGTLKVGIGEKAADSVFAVFADPDPAWRPGIPVTGECVTDMSEKEVLAVPSEAIVQVGVKPIVFVRDEDEADHFIAFEVKTGAKGGGWTEITNFPDDDEEVVVRGQYELKLAMPSTSGGGAKKAGHFHADGAFHESDE